MAKYIDADAVIEELRQIYHSCDDWEEHISQSGATESEKRILINRASATKAVMIEVRLRVDKMLPADVVEVVRCKDCLEAKETAPGRYSCFSFAGTNDGNWYCPDGKRKEKNNDN